MRELKFSYFFDKNKGVKCVIPTKEIDLVQLAHLVKENPGIKSITDNYRITGDKSFKEKLPFFTPMGVFSKKSDASFMEHTSHTYNWVIPFDIDKKDNLHIENWEDLFINKIASDGRVLIAFTSPSGGIKGLVQGAEDGWSWKRGKYSHHAKTMREMFYPVLEKEWGVKLDPAQSTLSQSMFISHDPFVHCNPEAIPMIVNVSSVVSAGGSGDKETEESYFVLEDWLNAIKATKENKWQKISGIFHYVARIVSGGVISRDPAEVKALMLESFHNNPYIEDRKLGEQKMLRSWDIGMANPIPISVFASKKASKMLCDEVKKYLNMGEMDHLMRVGDEYYEIREKHNERTGIPEIHLKSINRSTFFDDYGKDAHHRIRKLDGFCNKPNYFGNSRIIDDEWNLWPLLNYTPAPGLVDNSLYMISHICNGEQKYIDILLDYLHLALFKPAQLLPILALVSKKQGTGKTTFMEWLERIVGGNAIIMESSKFEDPFNLSYATKHFIMIDEGEYRNDKKGIANKMKKWSTQRSVIVNEKYMKSTPVDYYGRIIIASNQEDSFIKIEDDDVRYFILRVPQFESHKKREDFSSLLFDEIPAFVHWLKERGLKKKTSGGERFWFSPEELETPWLNLIRKKTKDDLTWEIAARVNDWFDMQPESKKEMQTTITNFKEWLNPGYHVGIKYIFQTLEKMGVKPGHYQRGADDLQPEKGLVTNKYIFITREMVKNFLSEEDLQAEKKH